MQHFNFSPFTRKVSLSEKLKVKNIALALLGIVISGSLIIIGPIMMFTESTLGIGIAMIYVGVLVMPFSVIAFREADVSLRFSEFAALNNAKHESNRQYDDRPGMIFGRGNQKKFIDIVSFSNGSIAELGVYKCTTGSGKSRQDHFYSFVRVRLPRRLPNMILDSKKNNSFGGKLSNLPQGFSRDQHLSLEGDFDRHYSLYAPEQYHRDALYIFTPDVMHALVDSLSTYDCEIIDDSFYVFLDSMMRPRKLETIQEMIAIAERVGREISEQADYYADERVGDRSQNIVAEHGAKMKAHIAPAAIAIVVITVFLWLLQLLAML